LPLLAAPAPSAAHLPRWRGFNLLEKFDADHSEAFHEDDFRWIHELGFDFVRLPMDYRCWIRNHDWNDIDDNALRDVDQAVAWGQRYGIHVCLNLHRAPGYCVNHAAEPADLWTSNVAQDVAAHHWATLARRYRTVPSSALSFNLFNEPPDLDPAVYTSVVRRMVEAIRAEDPNRLILADGLDYGRKPVPELIALGIAQATRGYDPMPVSHYQAPWVQGSTTWPAPTWPVPLVPNTLYGKNKPDLAHPLVLHGPFDLPGTFRVHVMTVSAEADLQVLAGGVVRWQHLFKPGPGGGEWHQVIFNSQYRIYQNRYDRDYVFRLPGGVQDVELRVGEGDWMTWSRIGWQPDGAPQEVSLEPTTERFGVKPTRVVLNAAFQVDTHQTPSLDDRDTLKTSAIAPWTHLERAGSGVFVGEFGVWNHTPHDVAMGFLEDHLRNWKEAGWGWALWNFRGGFGILDSERPDVRYTDFHGHALDADMLHLLQQE
jgi:aryl-phospho-beta-D-glucosidase BglC (GH1 family)